MTANPTETEWTPGVGQSRFFKTLSGPYIAEVTYSNPIERDEIFDLDKCVRENVKNIDPEYIKTDQILQDSGSSIDFKKFMCPLCKHTVQYPRVIQTECCGSVQCLTCLEITAQHGNCNCIVCGKFCPTSYWNEPCEEWIMSFLTSSTFEPIVVQTSNRLDNDTTQNENYEVV